MPERSHRSIITTESGETYTLQFMELQQVCMIDDALNSLGEFGEVRLVVEKGRLRFLVTSKSFDALKYRPGHFKD